MNGKPGTQGGNSGKGGCRGTAGLNGHFILINRNKHETRTYDEYSSVNGQPGRPGKPGIGGPYGDNYSACADWDSNTDNNHVSNGVFKNWSKASVLPSNQKSPDGLSENVSSCHGGIPSPIRQNPSLNLYQIQTEILDNTSQMTKKYPKIGAHIGKFVVDLFIDNSSRPGLTDIVNRISALDYRYLDGNFLSNLKLEIHNYFSQLPSLEEKRRQKPTLTYILTALFTLESRHNSMDESVLVVDLKKFLRDTQTQIDKMKQRQRREIVSNFHDNYENNLNAKIDEYRNILKDLEKDLELNEQEIHDEMQQLYSKLKTLIASTANKINEVNNLNEQIKKKQNIVKIITGLKVTAMILSAIPKTRVIGELGTVGITAFEKIFDDKLNTDEQMENIDSIINESKEIYDKLTFTNETRLSSHTSNTYGQRSNGDTFNFHGESSTTTKRTDANHTLKANSLKSPIGGKLKHGAENMDNFDVSSFKSQHSNKRKDETQILTKLIDRLNTFNNHMLDYERGTLTKIQELKNLNDLASMRNELRKFNSKKLLLDFRHQLSAMPELVRNQFCLANVFNRMNNVMETMIDIHDRIDHYDDQNELIGFISHAMEASDHSDNVPQEHEHLKFTLDSTIYKNFIMQRYDQALEAFSYMSFPLFCEFANRLNVDEDELFNDNSTIDRYVNNLNEIELKFNNYNDQLQTNIHNHEYTYRFEREFSFFKWSSREYSFEIKQLLNGKRATLFADVKYSKLDVVKLSTVYLLIETKNETGRNNELLQQLLANFQVKLVHSGESNYMFKENVYSINSDFNLRERVSLQYLYKCKMNITNCEGSNESFKKIIKNRPFLSPYTMWDVNLTPIRSATYSRINIYAQLNAILESEEIVVSLNGDGKYISDEFNMNNNNNQCDNIKFYSKIIKN